MSIGAVNTGYGASSVTSENTSSSSNSQEVGLDQFLKLFITQIQHQDPLSPLDSAEFTAQLAQFTSVEQLFGIKNSLTNIEETLNNQDGQRDDFIGFIGKTVKANDNTMLVDNGTVKSGSYSINNGGDVVVNVYDSQGLMVRSFYKGREDAGEHAVNWDGRDNAGKTVKNGIYTFEVTARDTKGMYIPSNTYISGEVTGITYQYGQPYLMVGDRIISNINNIVEVSQTTADS